MMADDQPGHSAEPTQPAPWKPPAKHPILIVVIMLLAAAAVLAILAAWQLPPFDSGGPRTDNAYIEGTTTSISTQVGGYVTQVLVPDFAQVKAGQLLVVIDDASYRAKSMQAQAGLDEARAQLANNRQQEASARATLEGKVAALGSARAQLVNATLVLRRDEDLVVDGSVARRERDTAQASFHQMQAGERQAAADVDIARQNVRSVQVQRDVLAAQVGQARAALFSADIDLARTRIRAPQDGQLSEVRVRVGALAATGAPLFTLVPPAKWVIANYKEQQTHGVRVGQAAHFTVDGLDGQQFRGVVERIAPATGAVFAGVSASANTGNFVKVPQRLGIRIAIFADQPAVDRLRPGMSVEARIDTVAPHTAPVGRDR